MGQFMITIGEWAGIISSLASLAAVVFVVIELRNMDRHRDLEISMKLFEWGETDRFRKAFRWIESEFEFKDLETYRANFGNDFEASDYPYLIESYFEEVGFLVNKKLADLDVIVDRLGSHIVANWQKLEPWIVALRNERKDKTFGEHFEILYAKTVAYMKKQMVFKRGRRGKSVEAFPGWCSSIGLHLWFRLWLFYQSQFLLL